MSKLYEINKKQLLQEMLIDEGLIKTNDIQSTVDSLRMWTRGKNNQPVKIFFNEQNEDTWGKFFKVDFKTLIDDYKKFLTKTNNYGWFPSTIDIMHEYEGYGFYPYKDEIIDTFINDENVRFLLVKFEPKYDFEYNAKKLYHITERNKVNKILKLGLSPKTNSKVSVHPERIYFLVKPNMIEMLVDEFKKIKNVEYCLLEINLPENHNIKLYRDVNMDWGLYSLRNIRPEWIQLVECDL